MLRRSLADFAEETSVFGLHMFRRPRGTFEAIFWCVFVAILSGYTTRTLAQICTSYVEEEVTTVIEPKHGENFTFPSPLLIINATHNVKENGAFEANIDDVLAKYIQTGNVADGDILTAVKFLSVIQDLEKSLYAERPQNLTFDVERLKWTVRGIANRANVNETLKRLVVHSSAASLIDFYDFLIQKCCVALRLRILFSKEDGSQRNITICGRDGADMIDSSGNSRIFIALNSTDIVFTSSSDLLTIILPSLTLAEFGFNVTSVLFRLSSDNPTDTGSEFKIGIHRRSDYHVRISAVYENLNLRRRPCLDDRELAVNCDFNCELGSFLESIGCIPLYFWYDYNTSPLKELSFRRCDTQDYLNFTNTMFTLETSRKRLECLKTCSPPCSKPIFVVATDSQQNEVGRALAFISVATHDYPLIKEQRRKDFEGFLGDFGGALGLWLGISLASLIHIPIFIVQTVVSYLRRNDQAGEAPIELSSTDNHTCFLPKEPQLQLPQAEMRDNKNEPIIRRLDDLAKMMNEVATKQQLLLSQVEQFVSSLV